MSDVKGCRKNIVGKGVRVCWFWVDGWGCYFMKGGVWSLLDKIIEQRLKEDREQSLLVSFRQRYWMIKCQSPEMDACLVHSRNSKETVMNPVEWVRRGVGGDYTRMLMSRGYNLWRILWATVKSWAFMWARWEALENVEQRIPHNFCYKRIKLPYWALTLCRQQRKQERQLQVMTVLLVKASVD